MAPSEFSNEIVFEPPTEPISEIQAIMNRLEALERKVTPHPLNDNYLCTN